MKFEEIQTRADKLFVDQRQSPKDRKLEPENYIQELTVLIANIAARCIECQSKKKSS